MPLTVRKSARRRRNYPDEKLPERSSSSAAAQVMAPTRMKLRVRRRDNASVGSSAAAGGGPPEEEEQRSRESGGRGSRRKNTSKASTAAPPPAAAATASSSPPSSSASASARAVMAAEDASPDSKCPICLDRFNNLAYLDRCLHRFCFPCIQEWSHNKAECPLCKQPFASILHSVRAEDDFKEYTLRPPPANSSVAATVAMVAAMASAASSDHQMRLMLRRHRGADDGETNARRRRRDRGGRGGGQQGGGEGAGVWEWYLDPPPLPLPPLPHHPAVSPVVAEDGEEGEGLEEQRMRGGVDLAERGVIFEGLTGLGGAVAPVAPNDRASRRLMTRLAARQRLQREGGTVRRLRERETVAFRRALYRSGTRVRGVAGVGHQGQQQRDITADSFRRNPVHLNRLRPWLRRELTVLYGAHGSLVDIVQRIIMARLARHGLEDTPTIEEELRQFLLARTDHFLHELVSFARSPLSLENYDLQAVYEPPAAAMELDGVSSSSDSSSVIAISEGEEEERRAGGRSEETRAAHDDIIQTGSNLSLAAWDDETPGPSYSSAEPSCSLASLLFSPAPPEAANEEEGEKREEEECEEECLIVGYKKPIAERTPELVQLSSDSEEEEEKKKKEEEEDTAEKLPPLATATPPLSYLPTIPPSTSGTYRDEQDDKPTENDGEAAECRSRGRSWSGSSGRSGNSVCTLSPATPPGDSERRRERASWRERKQPAGEGVREKRRRKRSRRARERSGDGLRKSGTLYNPNRSIYPAMMRHRSHSPSPFHSSVESGSPLPPSPSDSTWEYHCSQVSPLTSSVSSPSSSSSSPLCSSPQPSSQTPPTPSLSPGDGGTRHGEKPGGKRKYKSRHLDNSDKDPTWRPSSDNHREERRERRETERRKRGREEGRRRQRLKRDAHRAIGGDGSSRRCREDRSPSVEIIYEGTIAANATQQPARKRRRKRHRKTQNSSSPVIITLDSDSSRDDANKISSSSSSPLSSQQTVDFSDLPPLALVHSGGVGGALNAEIGDELPVDILDRGSDGSETEPAGRSEAAGPIAVDNSDQDVDVESVEESGVLLESGDDRGVAREADTTTEGSVVLNEVGTTAMDLVHRGGSEVATSDSCLLAAILNDLKGIAAPTRRRFRDQCEVSRAHSDRDGWSTETRHPSLPEEHRSNSRDQNLGFDMQTLRPSVPPLPPLGWLKEGKDVPPLLKQASPVRSYNRNTPPPLKHKDAGSPHLLPVSPVDLRSPHTPADADPGALTPPVDSRLGAELQRDHQAIPSISTLKRNFTSALALRGEPTCTTDSVPSKVGAFGIHSTNHKPPIDPHSFTNSADFFPRLNFNSLHSHKSHSSRESTTVDSTGTSSSPIHSHPVNSLSPVGFHHSDSTSSGCRNSRTLSSTDLHPTEGTPAGSDVLSGAHCNNTSPVSVSSSDARTQNPSSSFDPHSSVPTAAAGRSPSTADQHPRCPKSPVDFHSSERRTENKPSLVNHEERAPRGHLPPVDVHPVPPEHFNHTALSSSPTRAHNHIGPSSDPQFPIDPCSKHNPPVDSRPPADNHITSSPRPVENRWKSNASIDARSESQAPADERSAGGVWNTHTHSAT
ncbi:E3 ubiquitin-protein ligase Topors [Dicentrarchus labrax]|uniref:E3 ubiquitin-protein ligase Topors n=1 Tax=Dicentrarchus labrax TaxID=13489 RepID=A0A8P4GGU5_DICLA|nr:E3 ubiquitin-protein ligase Topors [Dicentrarchus labrax]